MKQAWVAGLLGVACLAMVRCANDQAAGAVASPSAIAGTHASADMTGSHGIPISPVLGSGWGVVNVSPTSSAQGFSAQIQVSVGGVQPNTRLYVQRAPEIGRPLSDDGRCQRAAGLSPWGPPTPNFVTFPGPDPGSLANLVTSAGGSGTVHMDFGAPGIADGTRFDVMFRLVDDLNVPTIDLRSACFTVDVK